MNSTELLAMPVVTVEQVVAFRKAVIEYIQKPQTCPVCGTTRTLQVFEENIDGTETSV